MVYICLRYIDTVYIRYVRQGITKYTVIYGVCIYSSGEPYKPTIHGTIHVSAACQQDILTHAVTTHIALVWVEAIHTQRTLHVSDQCKGS
jgi:hypothetical protein